MAPLKRVYQRLNSVRLRHCDSLDEAANSFAEDRLKLAKLGQLAEKFEALADVRLSRLEETEFQFSSRLKKQPDNPLSYAATFGEYIALSLISKSYSLFYYLGDSYRTQATRCYKKYHSNLLYLFGSKAIFPVAHTKNKYKPFNRNHVSQLTGKRASRDDKIELLERLVKSNTAESQNTISAALHRAVELKDWYLCKAIIWNIHPERWRVRRVLRGVDRVPSYFYAVRDIIVSSKVPRVVYVHAFHAFRKFMVRFKYLRKSAANWRIPYAAPHINMLIKSVLILVGGTVGEIATSLKLAAF